MPARALAAELVTRGRVVLSVPELGALALSVGRQAEARQELIGEIEKWKVFAEESMHHATRLIVEADRLAAIVAAPGIYNIEEFLDSEVKR